MELVLPDGIPVLERPIAEGTPRVATDMMGEKKKRRAVKYFVQNRVAVFVDSMLGVLYAEQPEDPLAWLMTAMFKNTPEDWGSSPTSSAKETDSIREYATTWKIPFLIDELLCDMLLEEPQDPEAFTRSWLRWNHKSFMSRHFEARVSG